MSFLYATLGEWNYGRDPIAPLYFESALAELKADLAAGKPVFQQLLRTYVLDNPHQLTLTLTPETTLAATLAAEEAAALEAAARSFGESDVERLARETAELKAQQAAHDPPEALARLPVLTTNDLERRSTPLPIEVEPLAEGATLLTHELPTDGIVYLDVALDLRRLQLEELPLLPLLTRMLSELGTAALDETAFSRRVGAQTGGLRVSYTTARRPLAGPSGLAAVGSADEMVGYLVLRGKSVAARSGALFELAAEMLTATDLDQPQRAIEMLKEAKVGLESSAVSAGNSYASSALAAQHSLAGHVDDLLGGLPQYATIKEALALAQTDWPSLRARLERMRAALLTSEGALINLSADAVSLPAASALVPSLLARLPARAEAGALHAWERPSGLQLPTYTGLQVGTQVNYVAKGCPIYAPGELVRGQSSVITRYLRTAYLWDAVRVQGGAYGCSLGFGRTSGVATYSSYRDPNVAGAPCACKRPLHADCLPHGMLMTPTWQARSPRTTARPPSCAPTSSDPRSSRRPSSAPSATSTAPPPSTPRGTRACCATCSESPRRTGSAGVTRCSPPPRPTLPSSPSGSRPWPPRARSPSSRPRRHSPRPTRRCRPRRS